MAVAYLGLGGNVGDAALNLDRAIELLHRIEQVRVTAVSRYYRTAPVGGPAGQSSYVNAVAAIDCGLGPRDLLLRCLAIERTMGRVRLERWGPRTIDIDLLLYDDLAVCEPGLFIPHPMLRERLFVLIPLGDVAPGDLCLPPDGRSLSDVLANAAEDPELRKQGPIEALENGNPTKLNAVIDIQ